MLVALAPKLMLSLPQNFRCFSNSTNFFNFYTFFLIACQVKTLDLISECAFSLYVHIMFFGFPLPWSHLSQESSFFSPALLQGAAV